jgi:hypothetical protein
MALGGQVSLILAYPHSSMTTINPHILTALCFILSVIPSAATDNSPLDDQRQASPGHTTYHIDPTKGDDANSGMARDQAWRSFRGVNRLRLAAGDRIEVIAPGAFDHSLMLAGSGTKAEPIEVRFAPGSYDIHPTDAYREAYQISNTNADPEGRKAVGILVAGVKHLRISGPDAVMRARGKMIHVCIDAAEGVMIDGLAFDYHRPTVSEFRVTALGDGFADLAIHKDSAYAIKDGSIIWKGEGWSETTGLAQELNPQTGQVKRRKDPLIGLKLEEIAPFQIRAHGKHGMKADHVYQIRNPHRDCAGAFTRNSRDITWKNVHFRFMHGMGIVSQFTENLTFDAVTIAPDQASGRTTAAWADCIQASGCRGKVLVKNCIFSGAHDDAVNIHGTHLRVVDQLPDRKIKVRFIHPQTFGFMAFHPGDEVEFVHWDSLATYGPNRAKKAELLTPMEMMLTLENPLPEDIRENDVLENVTWTPEVEIRGCKVSHIPTRGFLITTRRPVLVEDNEFRATNMSAILIEDDAAGWFESGCVRDMTIRNNRFLECGEPVVHINPRNTVPNPTVHQNIRILDNEFLMRGAAAIKAHSATNLRITGNKIHPPAKPGGPPFIDTSGCAEVVIDQK